MFDVYEVRLSANEAGGFDAYIPSIDMTTAGADVKDALSAAADLVYTAVPCFLRDGVEIRQTSFEPDENQIVSAVYVDCDAETREVPTMTVQEAADMLDVSESRVHALIKAGALDSVKQGTCRLVTTESVRRRVNSPRKAGRPKRKGIEAEKTKTGNAKAIV